MIFACGVSNYSVEVFHLSNHTFFKALLFLGAGSVIHAVADEQDMRRMGGLKRLVPFTFAVMLIGSLALMGSILTDFIPERRYFRDYFYRIYDSRPFCIYFRYCFCFFNSILFYEISVFNIPFESEWV